MSDLKFVILIFFVSCVGVDKNEPKSSKLSDKLIDSFRLENKYVSIKEVTDERRDTFRIVCEDEKNLYLNYTHTTPSEFIRIENIVGDDYPEIVIDDCVADEFGGLLIFKFDKDKRQYFQIPGTDSLSTAFYKLSGTEFFMMLFVSIKVAVSLRFLLSEMTVVSV